VQCGDIGSPGFTHESPPQIIAIEKLSDGALLTWRAVRGFSYRLEYCDILGGQWHLLKAVLATDNLPADTDQTLSNSATRFYRIIRLPPP